MVAPRTCILIGADGENADDCTTHEHEDDVTVEAVEAKLADIYHAMGMGLAHLGFGDDGQDSFDAFQVAIRNLSETFYDDLGQDIISEDEMDAYREYYLDEPDFYVLHAAAVLLCREAVRRLIVLRDSLEDQAQYQ